MMRTGPLEIPLDLGPATLVYDFPSHRIARVSKAVARGSKHAAHAVHAFTEHDLDRLRSLFQDDTLERLPGRGHADGDLLVDHLDNIHRDRKLSDGTFAAGG